MFPCVKDDLAQTPHQAWLGVFVLSLRRQGAHLQASAERRPQHPVGSLRFRARPVIRAALRSEEVVLLTPLQAAHGAQGPPTVPGLRPACVVSSCLGCRKVCHEKDFSLFIYFCARECWSGLSTHPVKWGGKWIQPDSLRPLLWHVLLLGSYVRIGGFYFFISQTRAAQYYKKVSISQ